VELRIRSKNLAGAAVWQRLKVMARPLGGYL
jgi:hypothetical protein